ncbi:retrovirus-related pol polyprotein from transposon TNT 1-94 [Tanacetum coccineum]|uniref:Retrovirus-related pol polyprotein from transposon TNT 1-94 n=1 Tax=Tanacetum coccineum TaxID=301880 RepID=A0ABQ4YUI3_9ASTR
MLYEKTSKAWKWWIEQQCPSGYKWVPKTKMKRVPKVRNETVKKRVSFAIDNASRITNIVQLILFIVDSGCTKHMTGNISILCNFVEKYLGTVRFGNDQFTPILGYEDLVQGNIPINRVYYVEGLNHNLFSVGQFCDANLEVAFRKSTCFIRDLQGNGLLTGNRGSDLYIISLQETITSTPICLMAKASPTQAWLWHRRLSHLNFDYINLISKKDVVIGLPKLKYVKGQLCSFCEVASINGKKYILVNEAREVVLISSAIDLCSNAPGHIIPLDHYLWGFVQIVFRAAVMFSPSTVTYTSVYINSDPVISRASDKELEAPIEDQPLPADASPTALSPGYIADFDLEEDEEDPKEDPADHPVDGGDNDDNESSDDDDDDDDVVKDEEDEEEEEHLAPADPSVYGCLFIHNLRSPSAEACITEFAAALPSSLPPPPENIKSLKDNIRV